MRTLIPLLSLLLLFSCGSDDGPGSTLTRIEIASSNGNRLDLGTTTTLSINGFDQANQAFTISTPVQWSASNGNVTVDQDGVVTAAAVGSSTVTASTESVEATFDITVWDSSAPRTEIWVSDAGNLGSPPFQILIYDENGENARVFTTEGLNWPQDILFLEEQNTVLISNLNNNAVGRYNIASGRFMNNFATGISGPTRMKIGPDGLLYVLQWTGNGKVKRYQLDGTFVDDFTSGVNQSIGLDWDSQGNLYISSFSNGNGGFVRKFDTNGQSMGDFISTGLQGPTDIWFDNAGNLWANDWQAGSIKRFSSTGEPLGVVAGGLVQNEGVAFLQNGNMLIGNGGQGNGSVKMYTSSGTFIRDLVRAGSSSLRTPNAVTVRNVN